MSKMMRRVSNSFAQLREALGFGGEQKNRMFSMNPASLEDARIDVKDNFVRTSKYSWITFLPVNLFQQLAKAANIYFLMITVMQTIKVISISNGEPTMLPPLLLVMFTSMCKDGYEDYVRHCEDARENDSLATVFNRKAGRFEKQRWGDVQIGDFVKVDQDEFFCADMVVVQSTEDEGVCYVETKNLDGETNLKNKNVPKQLWSTFEHPVQAIKEFDALLNFDGPNN